MDDSSRQRGSHNGDMRGREGSDPSADIFSRTSRLSSRRRPPGPWAVSLGLHFVLASLPIVVETPRFQSTEIVDGAQLLAENEHEIVWRVFREKLPPTISLREPPRDGTNAGAELRAPQAIVANDPNPQSSRQMIWSSAPAPEIAIDIPSPNLLAWTPPKVPRPRFKMDISTPPTPQKKALRGPAAPEVEATPQSSLDLQAIQPLRPLRYQSFDRPAEPPRPAALERMPAPEIKIAPPSLSGAAEAALLALGPLRYWSEPEEVRMPERKVLTGGPAPSVRVTARPELNWQEIQLFEPLRFPMVPVDVQDPGTRALEPAEGPEWADFPPQASGAAGSALTAAVWEEILGGLADVPVPAAEPSAEESGGGFDEQGSGPEGPAAAAPEGRRLAIVGVDPASDPQAAFSTGRRRGRFSAAPFGDSGSERPSGGHASPVRIPNLAVGGSLPAAGSSLAVFARRPPEPVADGRFQRGEFLTGLVEKGREAALRGEVEIKAAPENPEAVFFGRRVYTMAVHMPNISSRQGSWMVRFSEVGHPNAEGELIAPAPRVKVDPAYSRTAMEERIEGEVVLSGVIRSDGAVDHVVLVRALDERLDRAAMAAFSKWRFHPALKNGVPVDVMVVVRAPFSLTPLE